MKCPQCGKTVTGFVPFLLYGWVRMRCGNCHTTLILKSVGERFWTVLATGAVAVAAIWFFVDYPFRLLGEQWTLILFVSFIVTILLLAMYCAWKDSQFDLRSHS